MVNKHGKRKKYHREKRKQPLKKKRKNTHKKKKNGPRSTSSISKSNLKTGVRLDGFTSVGTHLSPRIGSKSYPKQADFTRCYVNPSSIQNTTTKTITYYNSRFQTYLKTWSEVMVPYPTLKNEKKKKRRTDILTVQAAMRTQEPHLPSPALKVPTWMLGAFHEVKWMKKID